MKINTGYYQIQATSKGFFKCKMPFATHFLDSFGSFSMMPVGTPPYVSSFPFPLLAHTDLPLLSTVEPPTRVEKPLIALIPLMIVPAVAFDVSRGRGSTSRVVTCTCLEAKLCSRQESNLLIHKSNPICSNCGPPRCQRKVR